MPRTYKKKREKKWTEEDIDSAINAVNSGRCRRINCPPGRVVPRTLMPRTTRPWDT